MPSFCVVANCEFKYVQSATISFHKFPFHTTALLQQWIAFTERGPLWQPSRWSSICSRHFLASDYRDHIFRKCLKRTAVPSVRVRQPFDSVLHQQSTSSLPLQSTTQINQQSTQTPSSTSTVQPYCRLCARSDPGNRHLDEVAIGQAIQKSFPNMAFDPDVRLSRQVCCDCLLQLNGLVQFIDRIVATQSELTARLGTLSTVHCALSDYREVPEAAQLPAEAAYNPTIVTQVRAPTLIVNSRTPLIANTTTTTSSATSTLQLPKIIHIKQEPLQLLANVKQEFVDSNRSAVAVAQPIKYPPCLEFQPDSDAFCEFCDVYFINNLELKTHIVNYHNSTATTSSDHDEQHQPHDSHIPSQTNSNCEIMEIITLENAFINLAEETEPTVSTEDLHHVASDDMIPLERVLKVEHFNDYEQREMQSMLIRREHSYCRRSDGEDLMIAAHSARNVAAQEVRIIKQEIKAIETATVESAQVLHTTSIIAAHQWSSLSALESFNKPEESQDPLSMYQCGDCSFQCLLLIELQQHIETDHRVVVAELFVCAYCPESFATKMQRILHRFRAHRPVKTAAALFLRRIPMLLNCANCAQKFTTKAAWKSHRIVCDRWHRRLKSFLRNRRSRAFNRVRYVIVSRMWGRSISAARGKDNSVGRQLNNTTQSSGGSFVCRSCGRNYVQLESYQRHLKLHKPHDQICDTGPEAEPPKTIQPSICPRPLDSQVQTEDTCRTLPNSSVPVKLEAPAVAKQTRRQPVHYKCDKCEAQFNHLLQYKHHLSSVHAVAKPYACIVCDKRFRCAENLRQHATTHSTERKHACTMCDKVFKRLAGLNQHVQGFHYKIRPHVCSVCSYAFALKGDMKRCRHSTLKNE